MGQGAVRSYDVDIKHQKDLKDPLVQLHIMCSTHQNATHVLLIQCELK